MAKRKSNRKSDGSDLASKSKKKVAKKDDPIPVTILSGFLGSGKTTLLKHILTSQEHKLKIAVIVNDMAELNIDGETIQRTKKEVVTLENGCICCTLRGDLIREIHQIRNTAQFDYVIIESTGIAEPQQVAESFCVDPETQQLAGNDASMLWNAARLDTCVTVVDVVNFPNYMSSLKRFQDIFQDGLDDAKEGEAEKSISELMIEQVEFANVILLNKVDLVSEKKIEIAKKLIHALNPKARIVLGSFGKMDWKQILNTQLFTMEEAEKSPGWLQSLQGGADASAPDGEADEYGVSSFVYRARTPFHPQRLAAFLKIFFCFAEDWNANKVNTSSDNKISQDVEKRYGSILRSKGTCWIAGRDDHEIGWAQAGQIIQLSPVAPWHCKTPEEEWEGIEKEQIRAKFFVHDKDGIPVKQDYGDRRQEIVFIGTNLQQQAIEKELANCLLTEAEMANHSADLPIGTYRDPLHPLSVSCDDAQSLFLIARPGQNQHIRVFPGFALTLHNMTLNITDEEDANIRAVKVWLDKSDSVPHGVLLATFRPGTCEQHSLSITLLPSQNAEEGRNHRLRVEVVPRDNSKMQNTANLINTCEVHILGKVEPLPYSAASDGEEEEEMDEEDVD